MVENDQTATSDQTAAKPKWSARKRRTVVYGSLLLIAFVGLVATNIHFYRNQPLTIINGTGKPALLQIDDGELIQIGKGVTTKYVAEGEHVVSVMRPYEVTHQINVCSSLLGRFFNRPAFLVNIGGDAVVGELLLKGDEGGPPEIAYCIEPVKVWDNVDFPFNQMPTDQDVAAAKSGVPKTALQWFDFGGRSRSSSYLNICDWDEDIGFQYAANILSKHPDDHALLAFFADTVTPKNEERFRDLMEQGIAHRPILLEWHRRYQDIPSVQKEYDQTIERYQTLLDQNPDSFMLLYLRGRIDRDPRERNRFLEEAIKRKSSFKTAHFTYTHQLINQGRWEDANDQLELAFQAGIEPVNAVDLTHKIYLGLNKLDVMQERYGIFLKKYKGNLKVASFLTEALAIVGKGDEAQTVMEEAIKHHQRDGEGKFQNLVGQAKRHIAYLQGDLKQAKGYLSPEARDPHARLIELESVNEDSAGIGELKELLTGYQISDDRKDALIPLVGMIKAKQLKDDRQAQAWRELAQRQIEQLGPGMKLIDELLFADQPVKDKLAHIEAGMFAPTDAAIVLTSLAATATGDDVKAQYKQAAESYLIRRTPPYRLLRQTLDEL